MKPILYSNYESGHRSGIALVLAPMAVALGLFVAVYAPAFIAVSLLRPPLQIAIPVIVAISLAIASALIVVLARRGVGLAQFGLRWPTARQVGTALLVGTPLALLAAGLGHLLPPRSPIDTTAFPAWMLVLYFGAGAPIQEEVIFRGLLQSFLARRWTAMSSLAGLPLSAAVLFTAILFGVVHLGSGIAVFAGALVLGLVAGELRRRSGSLVPAIIAHVLFNIPGLIWR
ncbi:MAG: CPBP family intramembrane glutamic endopeptidase [Lysobacterales bacterium]